MRHLDLFTGIGGFSLAAERAGMTTIAHSEIDPYASACLKRRFPHIPNLGDVTQLEGPPDVDIITAGSPCQDYSVAGRRAGTAGERSGLIAHTFRLAEETRAEWLVIENVPGLLSSNRGRDMGAVLGTLADLGMGFAYRVLDAQAFGVPQRRRRLFIVGHLGGSFDGPREVLSVGPGLPRDTPPSETARPKHPARAASGSRFPGVVSALTQALGAGGPDDNMAQAGHIFPVAFHLTQDPIVSKDHAHCLSHDATVGVTAGARVRKLTPLECERLQGFPDNWTEGSSDTQRYRQVGNAVAVPVASFIMSAISTFSTKTATQGA